MMRKQPMSEDDFIKTHIAKAKQFCALDNYGLTSTDTKLIVELLNQRPDITKLYLVGNNIGYVGADELTQLKYISDLNISNNDIGDKGAEILLNKSQFKKLDLSYNKPLKYNTLLNGITANSYLTGLDIQCVGLSAEEEQSIRQYFNKKMQMSQETKNPNIILDATNTSLKNDFAKGEIEFTLSNHGLFKSKLLNQSSKLQCEELLKQQISNLLPNNTIKNTLRNHS